jgi:putative ABC transport system ATP-binding protein
MKRTNTAAVVCRDLGKEFGSGNTCVRALRGVDLDVEPGQMTLLVGPSGCGKTTLLSIIAGLLEPTSGKLHVLGEDLAKMSPAAKVAFRGKHIGFVFQQFNLLPALTAAENVTLPLVIAGWRKAPALARARELLAKMGLAERAHAYPREMSGGQQQRVAIARALVHEPRLLVCDEPTSALDRDTGQRIMKLLADIAVEEGRAVLVVTHDERVLKFGDRIIHMSDGVVTRTESPTRPSVNVHAGRLAECRS